MDDWLKLALGIVAALLQVYMVLIFIRIILSWLSMDRHQPVVVILGRITDPYLNWFRRFRFLHINGIDFTPILALFVLNFFQILALKLSIWGKVTLAITLSIFTELVWATLGFFIMLYAILALVRFLSLKFNWSGQLIWNILDTFLHPLAYRFGTITARNKFVAYPKMLLIIAIVGAVLWVGGNIGFGILANLVAQLPL